MIVKNLCSATVLCLLLFVSASDCFAAPTGTGGTPSNTGLKDCAQSCETEYSKCGSGWLCRLQAMKCLAKCTFAQGGEEPSVTVRIRQKSSMRYLDAYQASNKDYRLVTRPKRERDSQLWVLKSVRKNVFTLQQKSKITRYIDAHEYQAKDFGLVTRPKQNNNTQRWIIKDTGNGLYTMQQVSNRRYVDAHDTANRDFEIVTRPYQNNNTQRWLIEPVSEVNFSTAPSIADSQKLTTQGTFYIQKRK